MRHTILKKQLAVTLCVVFCSHMLVGALMVLYFSSFWRNEKRELLSQNAAIISTQASDYNVPQDGTFTQAQQAELGLVCNSVSIISGCDIMITDRRGSPLVSSFVNKEQTRSNGASLLIMQRVESGSYVGNGRLNGLYDDACYVVGLPIRGENDSFVGAVFTAVNMRDLTEYLFNILRMLLVVLLFSMLLTSVVIGYTNYRMIIPLRQMAVAAREMGEGNFNVRVPAGGRAEDEISQLAGAFNSMAVSLSNSENASRSFIANVSHELKTPMTSIAGFIDGIIDGTIPPQEQKKYLQIVSGEVKRLSRLVRTMLDLSRIDNGELRLVKSKRDISSLIVNVMLSFEQKIEDKRLVVHGMESLQPTVVDCDGDMIQQVLYNLVDNAVKFANEGGYIAVQVREGGGRVTVGIENSGEGIEPQELPMVFDRFYKTDKSRAHDKNGMGLGLFIVRSMIHLHGGEITASSVQGEYTRFEFTLPAEESPEPKEPRRSRGAEEAGNNGQSSHMERRNP